LESANINSFILETDCKQLVDSIKAKKFQNNETRDILCKCVKKLSSFENCYVQFVSRQVNSAAHSLVRVSESFACQQSFEQSPSCIDSILLNEII